MLPKYLTLINFEQQLWPDSLAAVHRYSSKLGVGAAVRDLAIIADFPNIGGPNQTATRAAFDCPLPAADQQYIVSSAFGFDEVVALGLLDYRRMKRVESAGAIEALRAEERVQQAIEVVQRGALDLDTPLVTPLLKLRYQVLHRDEGAYKQGLDRFVSHVLYVFERGDFPGSKTIPEEQPLLDAHKALTTATPGSR